jgi:hypothetical protein
MEFFGFLGVFLAVPVAALLKIGLSEWHNARLLAAAGTTAQVPSGVPVEAALPAASTRIEGAPAER